MLSPCPFRFRVAVEAFEKAGDDEKSHRIGGIVSTDHLDRQGETLIQEGLDFEPFLKGGWFNDNHDPSTDSLIGYPETAELRELPDGRKGWYVEGYLLKGYERADKIWSLANSLQKSGRRLGFSVEGGITERDPGNPKTVRRATVREVAITRCPINTETTLNVLAKSLAAGAAVSDPGRSPGEGFPLRTESVEKKPCKRCKGKGCPVCKAKKSMSAGEAIDLLRAIDPRLSPTTAATIVDFAIKRHRAA
ncbi:MAG: hypothetical protein M3Q55_13200 [Acidobacteriota bacterium]|nr:hypothetical protein [Acidobacteriota bacterium]